MTFETAPATRLQAQITVDLRVLREMLRLPPGVHITSIRQHPTRSDQCVIELGGALPFEGELNASYTFENHTIVKFAGFTQVKP